MQEIRYIVFFYKNIGLKFQGIGMGIIAEHKLQ